MDNDCIHFVVVKMPNK